MKYQEIIDMATSISLAREQRKNDRTETARILFGGFEKALLQKIKDSRVPKDEAEKILRQTHLEHLIESLI